VVSPALTVSVSKHTFTANAGGSSVSGGASIASFTFVFGDGSVVGPQTGSTATHTFASPGTYTVDVTVTASTGGTATKQASAVAQIIPPTAYLVLSRLSQSSTSVRADASNSSAGDYPIASFTIDWGTGESPVTTTWSASGDVLNHGFLNCDLAQVTLTVTDTHGNVSASAYQQLSVRTGNPCP
jgi:PKD repeat protein